MKQFLAFLIAAVFATAAAAQDGYQVRSGDTLSIEVLEDAGLNRSALVTPDGNITFPFAGSIRVSGRTTGQIAAAISAGIAPQFAQTPTVFVSVASLRPVVRSSAPAAVADPKMSVFFLGEWNSPGEREVDPGITMLQALATGGGFTNFAAQKRIQLRRTNTQTGAVETMIIDYNAIANGALDVRDVVLRDGDILIAPERGIFE